MPELYSRHRLRLHAPGERLVFAVADAVPGLTRSKARQACTNGLIRVSGEICDDPTRILGETPQEVVLDLSQGLQGRPAGGRPFQVLYEDDHVIVVDKACGILSAPTRSGEHGHLPELLRSHLQGRGQDAGYIGVVHRIDLETSGCIAFARTRRAQQLLQVQFKEHGAGRHYRCLVAGQPRQDADRLTGRIGRGPDGRRGVVGPDRPGKDAVTSFQVLQRGTHGSDLAVELETGRTHQVRIHLAAIGCPVVGDPVYGHAIGKNRRRGVLPGLPRPNRLMLHAASLSFDHPHSGERVSLSAPLPEAYRRFAKTMGLVPGD